MFFLHFSSAGVYFQERVTRHYCAANGGEALGTAALFHRDQIALFSVEWPIKVVSPESNGSIAEPKVNEVK